MNGVTELKNIVTNKLKALRLSLSRVSSIEDLEVWAKENSILISLIMGVK
jgi:hypothetical protein